MTDSSPWKITMLFSVRCLPSISMGHLYHGFMLVIARKWPCRIMAWPWPCRIGGRTLHRSARIRLRWIPSPAFDAWRIEVQMDSAGTIIH